MYHITVENGTTFSSSLTRRHCSRVHELNTLQPQKIIYATVCSLTNGDKLYRFEETSRIPARPTAMLQSLHWKLALEFLNAK